MSILYTPRENAAEIIGERQQDSALVTRVMEYLGGELPTNRLMVGRTSAYLARYLPDVSTESLVFANQSRTDGFEQILWAGYGGDNYLSSSQQKAALVKPPFVLAKGQRRRPSIVTLENRDGAIGELATIYGETLMEYYQNLRQIVFARRGDSDLAGNTFDMTKWYRSQACRFGWTENDPKPSRYYYRAIMAMTTVFAALYKQNPYNNPAARSSQRFTDGVIMPAYREVASTLGVRPVIVAMDFQAALDDTDLTFLSDEQQKILIEQGSGSLKSAIMEAA
jgi:hypothetical protein